MRIDRTGGDRASSECAYSAVDAGRSPDFETNLTGSFRHNRPLEGEGGCRKTGAIRIETQPDQRCDNL